MSLEEMKSESSQVSIVLLSYDRPAYLAAALESISGQTYPNLEIIVVDNPSPASDEIARLVREHPFVKLIRNQTNLGYAGGMNRGLEAAAGAYIYLTEDDVVLERDCIARLVEYLKAHTSTGLCAPVIYNKTAGTIRCAGGELKLGGIYRRTINGEGEPDRGQFAEPFEVTYVDGAAMFARADFWRGLRGFRDEYFMYVEAVELCVRAMKTGRKLIVVPQAKVYHFEPPQQPTPPEIEFHKLKNFFSLNLLHAPARHLPEFLCRYALINTLRAMLSGKERLRPLLRAMLWTARRTPSLLRERYAQRA